MTDATIVRATDHLIDAMVNDLRPVPRSAMARRLAAGLIAGALASAALLLLGIGARPDLGLVFGSAGFWAKLAFALATAAVSVHAAARLGRPDARIHGLWLLPVPFLLYLPVGISELAATPTSQWLPLLLGQGWRQCTWLVLLLSLPVYSGLWWAFRKFAPTHEQATGAVAGLSSAAVWRTLAPCRFTIVAPFTGRVACPRLPR